jgi:tRNA (adenine22-N1)-methyltransferase
MSFSREGEKLSVRLEFIKSFYHQEQLVFDIGCDHGQLGLSFQNHPSVSEIHLVDPSAPVIETLRNKVKTAYITKNLFIHHEKGQKIQPGKRSSCIFVAGMGGREIQDIIESLLPTISADSRFVVSPHRNILSLRETLSKLPITLEEEAVVIDEGVFYLIMSMVPGTHGRSVSLYGERDFWITPVGLKYREYMMLHFKGHRDEAARSFIDYLKELKCPK